MSEREDEVVARCKAASYDERLADGMLYYEAADTIAALKAKCAELEKNGPMVEGGVEVDSVTEEMKPWMVTMREAWGHEKQAATAEAKFADAQRARALAAEAKCVELQAQIDAITTDYESGHTD